MVDRSITAREVGKITGSRMIVHINGSERMSQNKSPQRKSMDGRTEEFVWDVSEIFLRLKCGFHLLDLDNERSQLLDLCRRFEIVPRADRRGMLEKLFLVASSIFRHGADKRVLVAKV